MILAVPHLGLRGAIYLLALLEAQQACMRVTATPEGTRAVLETLATLGVVDLVPQAGLPANITVGDRLAWVYIWRAVRIEHVYDELVTYLRELRTDRGHAKNLTRHWQELLAIEATAYLRHQLRIHGLDAQLASELPPFFSSPLSRYSLGHWRYACWAATRKLASKSLQYPGRQEILRQSLVDELARRLPIALAAVNNRLCFSPSHSMPPTALATVFTTIATSLQDDFWRLPPSIDAICGAETGDAVTPTPLNEGRSSS